MQLTSALTRNSVLLFAGFFALVVWGFWTTYYSDPFGMTALGSSNAAVHLHGALMTLWCLMLVSQAYLIRSKQRDLHRLFGKSSYILAPALIVLQLVVVHNYVPTSAQNFGPDGLLTDRGMVFMGLTLGGTLAFTSLYGLAIRFRRNPALHMRFMVSTVFPALPAAIDRIVTIHFPGLLERLPQIWKSESLVSFFVADVVLIGLATWDWHSGKKSKVFLGVLAMMVLWQIFTVNAYRIPGWRTFGGWFLDI